MSEAKPSLGRMLDDLEGLSNSSNWKSSNFAFKVGNLTILIRLSALGVLNLDGSAHTLKACSAALTIRWQGQQFHRVPMVSNRPLTHNALMSDPLSVVTEERFAGVKLNSPNIGSKS